MNIENSLHKPSCYYKKEGEKLIFIPCPQESKCLNLKQEIEDTKNIINDFLESNSENNQQEALCLCEKILKKCEAIQNHEIICQIAQYKSLLTKLYYFIYVYHIKENNKIWLKKECQKVFEEHFKNLSDK